MNYEDAHNFFYNEIGEESVTMLQYLANDKIKDGLSLIKQLTDCDDLIAKALWTDLKQDFGQPENNPCFRTKELAEEEQHRQDVMYYGNAECPYCNSKNTKKISSLSKAGSVVLWGVLAVGKVSKQWHCNNCKSDF